VSPGVAGYSALSCDPVKPVGPRAKIPTVTVPASGSHETRRWRKADSNCWSHLRVSTTAAPAAGVQVKSGKVGSLNQAVAEDFDTFFVFMANPTAVVVGADSRLTRIGRDEIEAFARRCWALLPTRLQARWPNPTVT
jgi:hypothetical protein